LSVKVEWKEPSPIFGTAAVREVPATFAAWSKRGAPAMSRANIATADPAAETRAGAGAFLLFGISVHNA
jgi:hypothetical protein